MNKLSFEELDPKTTCCFTGHRPEKLRSGEAEIRTLLREAILDSIEEGYDTFISGMAPGVDLWAAQEVLAVKLSGRDIRLICAVPFPGAEKTAILLINRFSERYLKPQMQSGMYARNISRGALQQGISGW